MKTVFILGAGASERAGAPLMSDFLDRAHDLLRLKSEGVAEAKEEFEDVFNAISELRGIHAKSYLNLDNIEIVFGAIEMGLLLRRLGSRDIDSIKRLRNSMITLIYKTLEYSIYFPVSRQHIYPPKPYDGFMNILEKTLTEQPHQDRHEFSFITFNYDLCLDFALHHAVIPFDYCLEDERNSNDSPLLKLHGSINWGLSENDQIIPYNIREARFDSLSGVKNVYYNLGSKLNTKKFEGKSLKGPPVIIPPTWNKNSYHGQLSNVWSRAAREIAKAENIFIIGYSLPETDSFFRYLYALGAESSVRLRNFIVVNKDDTGQVETRFRQLIGRGIESRFEYIQETFENGLDQIKDILLKP